MARVTHKNALVKLTLDTDKLERLTQSGVTQGLLGAALYIEAERIMTDSKENYVPVGLRWYGHRPGNLRNSGTVQPPEIGYDKVRVTLGYDMNQAPYAYLVHERDHSIGQGKVKYLERPFLAAMYGIEDRLARYLQPRINAVIQGQGVARDEWRKYGSPASGTGDVSAAGE